MGPERDGLPALSPHLQKDGALSFNDKSFVAWSLLQKHPANLLNKYQCCLSWKQSEELKRHAHKHQTKRTGPQAVFAFLFLNMETGLIGTAFTLSEMEKNKTDKW